MNSTQIIDQLPYDLQARLAADDYFSDIPVLVADEGNIKLQIARKTAVSTTKGGKRGVAVIVLQVLADDGQPSIEFGPMTLSPSFQVVELVEVNNGASGTGKSARQVARRIRDVIKSYGRVGSVIAMKPGKPCIIPVNLKEDQGDNVRAYQIDFECLETPADQPSKVANPTFVNMEPAPLVGLACSTDGAAIYYTLDESFPWAGNPAAALYTAPIAVPASGSIIVTCCAYLAGSIASWVIRETVSATQLSQP